MRARQCSNDACGFPIPAGETECLICGQPVPDDVEPCRPINETWAASSEHVRSRSVLHLSFKSTRPPRLSAE